MTTLIKSAYNQKRKKHDHAIFFLDEDGKSLPSRTKQCHKEECDINLLIKKYDKHEILALGRQVQGIYGDFTEINEFAEAQNTIAKAQTLFNAVPSKIRRMYGDNPGEFIEFASNPANTDKLIELGLAVKPSPEKEIIQKVEIIETKPLETPKSE